MKKLLSSILFVVLFPTIVLAGNTGKIFNSATATKLGSATSSQFALPDNVRDVAAFVTVSGSAVSLSQNQL
jgi:cation transporter-like permease